MAVALLQSANDVMVYGSILIAVVGALVILTMIVFDYHNIG